MDWTSVNIRVVIVRNENAKNGYYVFEVMECRLPSEYATYDFQPYENSMIKVSCTELEKTSGWVEVRSSSHTINHFAESVINSFL
ncbi:hypothetical protein [Enterococcus casseliflavus]|uniref:hypothetical protein n=1 Tax=Enterococcus casseliflavus TaxID=37734 RepID=UPI0035CC9FBF